MCVSLCLSTPDGVLTYIYRQAPVSLAGALEEYIKDPNFEQNRLEYKANKQAAGKDGSASMGSTSGSVSSKSNASPSETKKPEKGACCQSMDMGLILMVAYRTFVFSSTCSVIQQSKIGAKSSNAGFPRCYRRRATYYV